jgi:hypothetical protein
LNLGLFNEVFDNAIAFESENAYRLGFEGLIIALEGGDPIYG